MKYIVLKLRTGVDKEYDIHRFSVICHVDPYRIYQPDVYLQTKCEARFIKIILMENKLLTYELIPNHLGDFYTELPSKNMVEYLDNLEVKTIKTSLSVVRYMARQKDIG